MKKEELVAQAIILSYEKVHLLEELLESMIHERCDYHVDLNTGMRGHYFLIFIKDGKIVESGTSKKILSWLNRRNVDQDKVYKYQRLISNII